MTTMKAYENPNNHYEYTKHDLVQFKCIPNMHVCCGMWLRGVSDQRRETSPCLQNVFQIFAQNRINGLDTDLNMHCMWKVRRCMVCGAVWSNMENCMHSERGRNC